jgi:hypothetical protein
MTAMKKLLPPLLPILISLNAESQSAFAAHTTTQILTETTQPCETNFKKGDGCKIGIVSEKTGIKGRWKKPLG